MNALNALKGLINKLKREEIKSLIKFLRYYQDVSDEGKGKAIQLVEAILADPNCTSKEIQLDLYGTENYHAFNKLMNRTKDKIYEVMLFDQNLFKSHYSKRNQVIFEIRKRLLQSEILLLRDITYDLDNFQNKIISKALSYEVYDSLIEALQSKQRFKVLQGGKREVEKIEKQILLYEKRRKKVQGARASWTRIGDKINKSTNHNDYISDLEFEINVLKVDYEETGSATIGYFYYFLTVEWEQIHLRYSIAEEILNKLYNLLLNNVSIYTLGRHGEVMINLANNEILLRDFHSAIKNATSAQTFFSIESVNYNVAREIEFYARFYNREIENAEKLISVIYRSARSSETPFLYGKWAYLYACLKTYQGDFVMSNLLLQEVTEIERDKEGWNLSKRVLTIINRIELNDLESADLKVLSLEKFIKRLLKIRHVRKRDIIILRILIKLINEGFDYEKVYKQRKKYFDLLAGEEKDYCWKIKSPELIVFHDWFMQKMNISKKQQR